ncbi:ECF transporter S component [Rubrobacter indicoceani]|uniref:ECF transporter S component n=1 Tax=Rubrobacter indicoceani TaxID=2051957 RepID=UPI000E5AE70E|nr:ECF transporter S component [Rubrobacter indicoceani]
MTDSRDIGGASGEKVGGVAGSLPAFWKVLGGLLLGALTLGLGVSGLGLIPVPNSTGNATVMHVPAVLAGVFGGPLVGVFVGLVFGGFSWIDYSAPIFRDPVVALIPRLLIGPVAWGVFVFLRRGGVARAAALAGVAGSATNSVGVLSLAVGLGYFPLRYVWPVLPQAFVEAGLAGLAAFLAVQGYLLLVSGRTAEATTPEALDPTDEEPPAADRR